MKINFLSNNVSPDCFFKAKRFLGVFLGFLIGLQMSCADAGTSMLSFFPEDIAVEKEHAETSPFNIEKLARLFPDSETDTTQERLQAMQSDIQRLIASPPKSLKGETGLACTAVAVFFEARGESTQGQKAVASVVLERALTPGRWGNTPCSVVLPVQFTFMKSRYLFPSITQQEGWQKTWPIAVKNAALILASGPMPELHGANHYHTRQVHPKWSNAMPKVAVIGNHIFYADPVSKK